MESLILMIIKLYKEVGRIEFSESTDELYTKLLDISIPTLERITIRKKMELIKKRKILGYLVRVFMEESIRMYLVEYAFYNNIDYDENSETDIFRLLQKVHDPIFIHKIQSIIANAFANEAI